MNEQATIYRIRHIRRSLPEAHPLAVAAALECLEHEIAGTETEDFDDCPVEGFDTILSYLARTNPEAFSLMDEPVHGTIREGFLVAQKARIRGLPIIRVVAPAHMRRRFPKATHVNAYPTHLLVEIFG
jgi:hypothetical protein